MEYEIRGGSFPIVICTLQEGETIKNIARRRNH